MFLSDAAKRVGQFFVNLLEILIDDNDCHLKHLILTTRLQLPEGSCLLRHGYKKIKHLIHFWKTKNCNINIYLRTAAGSLCAAVPCFASILY